MYSAATPRVPNHVYDKSDEAPDAKRLTDSPVKNGLAFVLCVNTATPCIRRTDTLTAAAAASTRFFVKTAKAKNKKAVKLIIPSAKTAVTPAYSLTSAPAVIKISGEADIKIEAKKPLIPLSPVLRLSE